MRRRRRAKRTVDPMLVIGGVGGDVEGGGGWLSGARRVNLASVDGGACATPASFATRS